MLPVGSPPASRWFLLCLFLLVTSLLKAQSPEELLQLAIDNNLELKVLHTEYLSALEKAPQVSQMPDPEFGAGVFPLPVETRLGAQVLRLGATQMLPWFGTLDEKANLEMTKAKGLQEKIQISQLELFYNLKTNWYQLYELNESQEIIRRNIRLLETLERLALAKVESGKGNTADVLRIQLKTIELQQQLDILEVAKTAPRVSINQLLNRNAETEILISDSLTFTPLPFNHDAVIENIPANHPGIKMLEWQQEAARQTIAINELNSKPVFGVGLDYILVNERNDAEPEHNGRDIVQLRGSVRIPLNKDKYSAREREENLRIEAIEQKKEDALSRYRAMIDMAYAKHEAARLQLELYEKQIEITAAAIRILESTYSASGNRFDELLQLEKDLIDFDFKILKTIVQSHLAKASIERFVF